MLKSNATLVPAILGSENNGYLGLVLTTAQYNLIVLLTNLPNNSWNDPIFPEVHPPVPDGTMAVQLCTITQNYMEAMCLWTECCTVHATLCKQHIQAINEICVQSFYCQHSAYNNAPIRDVLHQLFKTYAPPPGTGKQQYNI